MHMRLPVAELHFSAQSCCLSVRSLLLEVMQCLKEQMSYQEELIGSAPKWFETHVGREIENLLSVY